METNIINAITENLFGIFPLIHRVLLKVDFNAVNINISRPHFVVMKVLDELGAVPVSTVGKKLIIAKPQMTRIIDRLIDLEIVERQPDLKDRRIINIRLTEKGIKILEQFRELTRDNIRNKLSCLKDEELSELLDSLNKVKNICTKLEEE